MEPRADINQIMTWLEKCGCRFPRLARTIALALLTLAGIPLAGDDDDAGDDHAEGWIWSVEALRR